MISVFRGYYNSQENLCFLFLSIAALHFFFFFACQRFGPSMKTQIKKRHSGFVYRLVKSITKINLAEVGASQGKRIVIPQNFYEWLILQREQLKFTKAAALGFPTQFRSQHGHLKSRRYFSQVVQVELWNFARPC